MLTTQHIIIVIGLVVLAWAVVQGLVNRGQQRKSVPPKRKPRKR